MRIIKPQQLVLLKGGYQLGRKNYLGISVVAGFYLSNPSHFASEPEIWKGWGDSPLSYPVLDTAEPKPYAEYLLAGHAGIGEAVSNLHAGVSVGGLIRKWYLEGKEQKSSSEIEPFLRMALDHTQSYGGQNCEDNLLGRGHEDDLMPKLMEVDANGEPIMCSPLAAPTPLPTDFAQRKVYLDKVAPVMGSAEYLEEAFPGYPAELDLRYFQIAPPAQRYHESEWPDQVAFALEGFGHGAEDVSGEFPCVRAQVMCAYKDEPTRLQPLLMQKKTLWLLPDSDLGLIVFTGHIQTKHLFDNPIDCIVIGLDNSASLRDISHYQSVFEKRSDENCCEFEFLYDPDLMPTGVRMNVVGELKQHPSSLRFQPGVRQDDINYYQQLRQHISEHQQRLEKESSDEKAITPVNVDWDRLFKNEMNNSDIFSPEYNKEQPVASEVFLEKSFDEKVLTGLVFQQCLFKKCTFTKAQITQCLFAHCQFEDCCLDESIWIESKLERCCFADCQLNFASINNSVLNRVTFNAINSNEICWDKAELLGCSFEKCYFNKAKYQNVLLDSCAFSNSQLLSMSALNGKMINCTFNDSILAGSALEKVEFMKNSILGCDCSSFSFIECQLDSVTVADNVNMSSLLVSQCALNKVGLQGVNLSGSKISESLISETNFAYANMSNSNFILCDVAGAHLKEANMQNTIWERSSLQQGILYHADIRNTHFIDCNLISANMAMTISNSDSRFYQCMLDGICWYPRYKKTQVGSQQSEDKGQQNVE